jgi:hypothetical protein
VGLSALPYLAHRLRMRGAIRPFVHMSSWFGVLLNTGTNSAFTFYPGNIIYELNNFEQLIINDVKNKFINLF